MINGQKIWTSFGEVADYCYLICRTSTEGPPHAGISEIIVPMDTPGIEVRPIKDMTTNRHFCEVFFTDVRVPVAQPRRRRGRGVQADDAPARARARRHRPPRLQPRAVPMALEHADTIRSRSCARRSPRWRSATASGGCS